jgi:hypothetical protein
MARRLERPVSDWKRLFPLIMQSSESFQPRSSCLTQKLYGKESLALPRLIRQLAWHPICRQGDVKLLAC